MVTEAIAVDVLLSGKDETVRRIYEGVLEAVAVLGPVRIEPKKTSVHLARSSGFAGVHPPILETE